LASDSRTLPVGAGGSEAGRRMAQKALTALGTPYAWGGGGSGGPTNGGFDCSGLVQWATAQSTGVQLPRTTYDLIRLGTRINPTDAQPGDLVFSDFSGRGPQHVQIALGAGKVVHLRPMTWCASAPSPAERLSNASSDRASARAAD
jgi:cell wall-associated NlpC family hydrolase